MKAALTSSFTPSRTGLLQRRCANDECEERRKKMMNMQRSTMNNAETAKVPSIVHDVLNSPGEPLDTGMRSFMEPLFGFDFGRVRIHTDARAAESARAVNALAYTVERDVVFGTGQYEPGTSAGQKLLAHELTHVTQQMKMAGMPTNSPQNYNGELKTGVATEISSTKNNSMFFQSRLIINGLNDDYEKEAEAVAEKVVQSSPMTNSNDIKPSLRNNLNLSHAVIQRISANESPYEEDCEYIDDGTTAQTKSVSGIVQRMKMRNTSGGQDHIKANVVPWGGTKPKGDKHFAYTNSGTSVIAWTAIDYYSEAVRYWCHGHTLGTYRNWLYSVFSGNPMQTAVTDEYTSVPEEKVQKNDIAVWVPNYDHSCIVDSISRNNSGIDDKGTMMSTKNGMNPLVTTSLASVKDMYSSSKNAPKFFRHK